MTRTVTRMFDTRADAEAAVRELEDQGVPSDDITIITPSAATGETRSFGDANRDPDNAARADEAAEDAGKGAGVGGVIGAGAGLLAGLGMIAIPGIGPVVAAGWLASTLAGAATGAVVGGAAGGVVGALTKEGVSEGDAHVYAEGVRRGRALVSARVDDVDAPRVEQILARGVDAATLGAEYRQSGWTQFDGTAGDPGARPL